MGRSGSTVHELDAVSGTAVAAVAGIGAAVVHAVAVVVVGAAHWAGWADLE